MERRWGWGGKSYNPAKPMRYTATVMREREIIVEAETPERATKLIKRRLEKDERILSVQTSLL